MPCIRWTQEEIETLTILAKSKTSIEVANEMNRSVNGIRAKANRLGIDFFNEQQWSQQEVDYLDLWAGSKPVEVIARLLNKSKNSVKIKAHYLGISLKPTIDHFDSKSLASILQIYHETVRKWIRQGKLKAYKSNKKSGVYRISSQQFKNFYAKYNSQLPALQKIDPERLEYLLND